MKAHSYLGWAVGVAALLMVSCAPPMKVSSPTVTEAVPPGSESTEVEPAPTLKKIEPREVPADSITPKEKKLQEPPVEDPVPEPKRPEGTISRMDLGTLFELQGEGRAFIVDVRPALFYNLDHIPGAISLPLKHYDSQFPAKKSQFDAAQAAGKVIVLYCADENCPDGRSTARKLARAGYSSSVYTGGWKEWKASGL